MTISTQSFRDEHRELHQEVDALQALADEIGTIPVEEIAPRLDAILVFLTGHLLAHAQAEEQVLFPVINRVPGVSAMKETIDHVAIRRMTDELRALRQTLEAQIVTGKGEQALRRLLYGLHALVHLHLGQEEEMFSSALDTALSPEAVHEILAVIHRTTQDLVTQG